MPIIPMKPGQESLDWEVVSERFRDGTATPLQKFAYMHSPELMDAYPAWVKDLRELAKYLRSS